MFSFQPNPPNKQLFQIAVSTFPSSAKKTLPQIERSSMFKHNPSVWLSPVNMIHFFLLCVVPNSVGSVINKFILESNSFLKSIIPPLVITGITTHHDHHHHDHPVVVVDDDDDFVHGHDVAMLMEKMGLPCDPEGEEMTKKNSGEISRIFEEREPSIEELKEAFDVFDENKDGFIDALELKRVLAILGMGKGCDLEACERMLRAFDLNGDDRIDPDEFFRFMRKSLC